MAHDEFDDKLFVSFNKDLSRKRICFIYIEVKFLSQKGQSDDIFKRKKIK